MKFRLDEIARVLDADLSSDLDVASIEVDGVSIDSRSVRPGDLFVPLVAERDGHLFIEGARKLGAVAWLTEPGRPGWDQPGAVVVPDTAQALRRLGIHARSLLPDRVIGVTGSAGKTSTKDLLSGILRLHGPAAASEKSFNNELGVPLTLCNAPVGAWAAAIEMGARGIGHIASLCAVARPTVGVITNIGSAHRELFSNELLTARAKAELLQSLPRNGLALLNRDDSMFDVLAAFASCRVESFSGLGDERATFRAINVAVDDELRPSFDMLENGRRTRLQVAARGAHQVANALAAAAAALAVGATLGEVVEGLSGASISEWRMDLRTAASGARILNDAYNANPASMKAALDALNHLSAARRVAVLGAIAELGPDGPALHRDVSDYARTLGVEVIAVGTSEYGEDVSAVASDIDDALQKVGRLFDGDVVLVKGSRVAGLERLAKRLLEGVSQ